MINAVSTHSTSTETCLQDKKWATFDTYSLSQNSYGLVMMMMIGWRSGDAVMSDVFWMVMPMMFLLRHYLPPSIRAQMDTASDADAVQSGNQGGDFCGEIH